MARFCLAIPFLSASLAVAEFCNCQFTIPSSWEPNCRVFGQANDKLIAFEKAGADCIEQLALQQEDQLTYSNDEMWSMCPFANGTNTNVQLAMNEIQFGLSKSTAVQMIREKMTDFFQLSTSTGTYELKDSIFDVRTSPIDCQVAPRNCWAAIREFVTVRDSLRALVCTEFHREQQADNANLQWKARLKLCEGSVATDNECEPLKSTISKLINEGGGSCPNLVAQPSNTLAQQVLQCDFENPLPPPSSASFRLTALPKLVATLIVMTMVHVG